ncbi:hypothetical protein [Longitalea arenae]|uniref:hypothetical protein n=1 Tax=Longitalea arenae TaxID=2812558 RepID=UPI001966DEF8|nr:hypothetical protein [Longitalea arenae]
MSNQKPVKYLLIGGVVVVWGLIIYRVVDGLSPDEHMPAIKAANTLTAAYAAPADSFTLIADYSDPFIPGTDTVDAEVTPLSQPVAAPMPAPVVVKPPVEVYKEGTIQYEGMISNPQKKIKLGAITLNGKELLVREKDKVEGYVVQKISAEMIVIRYKNKNITIQRCG